MTLSTSFPSISTFFLYAFLITLIYIVASAFYLFIIYPYRLHSYYRKQNVTGPELRPFGQLPMMKQYFKEDRQLQFWHDHAQRYNRVEGKKQQVYNITFGIFDRLVITDPDMVQSVLKTNAKYYSKGVTIKNTLGVILGMDGLLLSEGEHHQKSRKIIAPAFHYQNLHSMIELMALQTQKSLASWTELINKHHTDGKSGNVELEMHQQMSDLTLNIVAASVFGSSFLHSSDVHHVIYHSFNTILSDIQDRALAMIGFIPIIKDLPLPSKRRIDTGVANLRRVVDVLLDDRRTGQSSSACHGADLLDLLLAATDPETGEHLPNEEIKQQLLTFVLAGHETTSNLLSWAIRVLAERPDIWSRIRTEIDSILPNHELPTASSLSSMIYTDAVLHEIGRMYPPVPWTLRQAEEENVIGVGENRVTVPKGGSVILQFITMHYDPANFPNPTVFDPDRWLKKEDTKRRHPYAYQVFGSGPRGCIGNNFAMMEAKVILAMMVQNFDLSLVPGQKIVEIARITMRPKYGLKVHISPRSNPSETKSTPEPTRKSSVAAVPINRFH